MLLDKVKIHEPFKFVGRAASRSIVGTLNFTIANLCASVIRKRLVGVPAEDMAMLSRPTAEALAALQSKFGPDGGANTLDARNELDEAARGEEHESRMREEMGFSARQDPLELAGLMLVVRDALAADLDEHARMLVNPLDPKGSLYKDPYETAPTLEQSFVKQLEQAPKVNEVRAKAQAEALKLPYESVLRVLRNEQEAGLRFLKANKDEIHGFLVGLRAFRKLKDGESVADLKAQGIEIDEKDGVQVVPWQNSEADEVFGMLPAIRQAGLYVAADRGLWYEMDRWIRARLRSHPEALGNMKAVEKMRVDIHAEFDRRMKHAPFYNEIKEAVERGSTWPTLLVIESIEALRAA